MKKIFNMIIFLGISLFLVNCSKDQLIEFQTNQTSPPYSLNHLFDAYPSIHEAMDGLSNQDLDRHLQEMLNAGTDVPAFLRLMGDLMLGPDLVPMLGELREIFDIIRDPGAKYYNDTNAAATGGFYANNLLNPSSEHFFYTALDDMMKNVTISDDVFGIMQQVTGYLSAKTPDEIKQSMDDLSASIEKDADPVDGVPDIKVTIHDISAALAKVLLACDYPMWLDASKNLRTNRGSIDTGSDTNIELGNMVKGANLLLSGLGRFAHDDQKGRQMVKDLIQKELPPLFVPGNNVHDALEALIKNIGTYFIAGGSGPGYKYETTDYHNADPYVNAGIKETMRDMLPLLGKLVIRKNSDPNKDFSIFDNGTDQSPLDAVVLGLNKLKESGIDYSLDENALEPSLYKALTLNADGKDRTAGGNGKLSHLDHLVYTTAAAYFFGYLTRIGSDGEPDSNLGYGHGAATKGVLTINDSMYSMSSNSLMGLIDSYSAGLTQRTRQGAHVGRSFQPFSSDAIADHHFFIGYDSPGLSMLAQNAAGDSGIPNGGEPISPAPTTDETPTGGDVTARNNWKSYFVKVADGKGVLNTSEFMLSWFVRACWDGQGPYYATSGASTTTFTMPVHGTQTVNVYKKPNGEVYAYVYKPDASPSHWEYYYPTSAQTGVGNDAADPDDLHGQRINRYKVDCKSDNYIIQVDYDDFGTLNIGYVAPPMNPDGSANMDENSTTLPSKYNLKKQATVNSSFFQVYERIGEKQETSPGSGVSVRECASQEEAIFRNYQWLLLEKKFLLVIPLSNYAGFATYDTGIFLVIEGNGIIGLTSAKKGKIPDGADPSTIKANGYWVKMGNEGIPGASHNPNYANNPDYGDSDILGDGRISVFGYPMFGASGVNGDVVLESLLGDGSVMPDVVAKNIAPIARLGFLQEDPYVASSDRTGKWSASWSSRNKVLPLLIAVFGQLRDGTYYDRTGEDESLHNYNYAGKHKYPIREVIEGLMVPLAKPHMRHFSDYGGRWVPRVKNEEGQNYACFASNNGLASDNGGFADTDDHYKPNDGLRSLLSVLAGDGDNATDGVLPLVTDPAKNIKLVSKVMALLQEMSGDSMTAARVTVGQGLEQILTGAKSNKGEIAQNNYSFIDNSNYGWMSTKRTEDLDLDIILDKIAQPDADWSTFDDFFNLGSHFIGGDRDITPRLANVVDAVLNQNLTAGQIQGVIYTLGKLFGKYEKGAWVYQGDDHGGADTFDPLYDLMMFIPQLNRYMGSSTVGLGDAGANYNLMMANIDKQVREPDSLARYLIKDMHTSYSMEQVFTDIGDFLRWKYVADPNSRLWNDLSSLLYDLSTVKDNQIDLNAFLGIYEFQRN